MMYESDSFTLAADSSCSGGDGGSDCDFIRESAVAEAEYPSVDGQQYYGRGAMMLRWSDGFGKFSDIAYDGGLNDRDILLASPDDVSTDGFLAFASAMWMYMTPVSPRPSLHEVMSGYYQASTFDVNPGNIKDNSFGTTTNVITNNEECGSGTISSGDQARADNFETMVTLLGLDSQSNLHCEDMANFDSNSSSYKPTYFWTKNLTEDNEC